MVIFDRFFKKKQKTSSEGAALYAFPEVADKDEANVGLAAYYCGDEKKKRLAHQMTLGETELKEKAGQLARLSPSIAALSHQWVNPEQNVNAGAMSIQRAGFVSRLTNFWECAAIANDPLFVRLFRIAVMEMLKEGYELYDGEKKMPDKFVRELNELYGAKEVLREAITLSFQVGGCLIFKDTEASDEKLRNPMPESEYRKIKAFRCISPLMLGAAQVNSKDPSAENYMEPELWYVAGKGLIHSSWFIQFKFNEPVKPLSYLSLYFGVPLTQTMVQDIANVHQISQSLASLVKRFRERYIKVRNMDLTGENYAFLQQRIRGIQRYASNETLLPIKENEDIQQLISPINGLENFVEMGFKMICAEMGVSMTKFVGVQSKGFGNKNEGDSDNLTDTIIEHQEALDKYSKRLYSDIGKARGIQKLRFEFIRPKKILNPESEKETEPEEKRERNEKTAR